MQHPSTSLNLVLYHEQLPAFYPFLQQGVALRVLVGASISDLLTHQFGIAPDYIRARLTTLFLNSRAIDSPDSAIVRDGSVLALSGAMPGLVGATMRSSGYYAAMRGSISHHETGEVARKREGLIRIKLFNLLLGELGPVLLREGIVLEGEQVASFLAGQGEDFWRDCPKALIDGKPASREMLLAGDWLPPTGGMVTLTVTFRGRI
jgi:hypothetical protein